ETIARRRVERATCRARTAQRGLADTEQPRELRISERGMLLDLVDGFEFEPGKDPFVPAADLADAGSAGEQRLEPMSVSAFASAHLSERIRSFEREDKVESAGTRFRRSSGLARGCSRVNVGERRRASFEFLVHPKVLLGREPNVVLEPAKERARVGDRVVAREARDRRADVDAVALRSRQATKEERQHRRAADRGELAHYYVRQRRLAEERHERGLLAEESLVGHVSDRAIGAQLPQQHPNVVARNLRGREP